MILALRTTVGRERMALDAIEAKVKSKNLAVKAVFSPAELKGYIFIEAEKRDIIEEAIKGLPHVRGIVDREVSGEDVSKYMVKQEDKQIMFKEGDLVEVVGGPFKREKAKVLSIDSTKQEAKIELVDSAVPIAITIKVDLLKPES